jgi:AmmeMemoRadiSam system protein B
MTSGFGSGTCNKEVAMIREPVVAGQFYSNRPIDLRTTINSYFGDAEPTLEAKAILCPHAGYIYSGAVAGAVFGAVRLPGRFIILGPNHTGKGAPLSIYPEGQWKTPLGMVSIDRDITEGLLRECASLRADRAAHVKEHSLEVQIPFIQARLPEFSFAAICVGTDQFSILKELGHALARVILAAEEKPLLVVSSDMNHYESASVAAHKDHEAIAQILSVNPEALYRVVIEKDISMCGFAPAVAALIACRDMGATAGRLIRYGNSGEVSGDFNQVVGYAGMVVS